MINIRAIPSKTRVSSFQTSFFFFQLLIHPAPDLRLPRFSSRFTILLEYSRELIKVVEIPLLELSFSCIEGGIFRAEVCRVSKLAVAYRLSSAISVVQPA